MLGVHEAATEFLHQATAEGQTQDGADRSTLRATRLMRVFTALPGASRASPSSALPRASRRRPTRPACAALTTVAPIASRSIARTYWRAQLSLRCGFLWHVVALRRGPYRRPPPLFQSHLGSGSPSALA